MGRIIAIANQKGGVGKTTTAINLAASLGVGEHRTLVIDLDPQANCTSGLGLDSKLVVNSVYELLIGKTTAPQSICSTDVPNLDILPATINLVGAELEVVGFSHREQLLARALAEVKKRYAFVIIDCPPSLGLLTVNALTAADSVLIPVQAEYFALEGLGQLLNTIKIVRKLLNPALNIEGILLTLFDARLRLSKQVAAEVRRYFGSRVFRTLVQRNVRVAEAPSFGKPVVLFDATCVGARNYLSLAGEIVDRTSRHRAPDAPAPADSLPGSADMSLSQSSSLKL